MMLTFSVNSEKLPDEYLMRLIKAELLPHSSFPSLCCLCSVDERLVS